MLPAAVWHPVLGKLLLIGSDMCCAVLCRALLLRLSPASPAARWASYVHLFNPIAINISSRGNADALICALLLLLLWLLTRGRVAAAGVWCVPPVRWRCDAGPCDALCHTAATDLRSTCACIQLCLRPPLCGTCMRVHRCPCRAVCLRVVWSWRGGRSAGAVCCSQPPRQAHF